MDKDDEPEMIGVPNAWTLESDTEHYFACPGCGALLDMRDTRMVLDHVGVPPHGKGIQKS